MENLTILTTGAGSPGAAGIFKAFRAGAAAEKRRLRIVTSDMDRFSYGFHLADKSYEIPAAGEKEFIPGLLEICRKEKPDLLFSWVTPELLKIASYSESFENVDVIPVISSPEAIEKSENKYECCKLFPDLAPGFILAKTLEEFEEAVKALGYPGKRVCFKPLEGYGMRGFRVLDEKSNLLEEKPENAVTNLGSALGSLASYEEFPRLMVMEYLPGREYTVDILLAAAGNPLLTIPRERFRIKSGISNIARLEKNRELIDAAEKVARKLGLSYNANIQFRYDSKGSPKLIEAQPRLSGTVVACLGAGANMPWLAAKIALGENIPLPEIKWGAVMKRFWSEVFFDGKKEWFL